MQLSFRVYKQSLKLLKFQFLFVILHRQRSKGDGGTGAKFPDRLATVTEDLVFLTVRPSRHVLNVQVSVQITPIHVLSNLSAGFQPVIQL